MFKRDSSNAIKADTCEMVVLLHGFAASSLVMLPLKWRLSRAGYRAHIWSYSTLRQSIAYHAYRLRKYLSTLEEAGRPYHIVAHSMGSIVSRVALLEGEHKGLQRVVFLAPPNRGLPIARWGARYFKGWSPPLEEIADLPESYVNLLPRTLQFPVGVIAAKQDMLIPIANTRLDGNESYIALNATHNSLLISSGVAKQIESFLRTGRFMNVQEWDA